MLDNTEHIWLAIPLHKSSGLQTIGQYDCLMKEAENIERH